ncbi:hypothetical protein LCGC14_1390080 [marine sediment metagenome]|uniref:Uncharacterized protein n=1 Tax=marine sediment metagenome TaxID=412755 RepID=A0A0F9MFU1_9ZZZZ
MAGGYSYPIQETEDKAGYNQAARITEVLAVLRNTFIGSMMKNDLASSLESCRGVLNVISGKVAENKIEELDKIVYEIEKSIPLADQTYSHNGSTWFKNFPKRIELKKKIENLWRDIERTQDKHGYGMVSEEDSGL